MIFLVLLSLTKIFAFPFRNLRSTATPSEPPTVSPTDWPTNSPTETDPPTNSPTEGEKLEPNCVVYSWSQCITMLTNDACEEVEDYITNGKEMGDKVWQDCYTCNTDEINASCGIGTSPNNEASNDEAKSVGEADDTVQEQNLQDLTGEQEEDDSTGYATRLPTVNRTSSSELKMLVLNLGNYNELDDSGVNSWLDRLQRIGDFIVYNSIDLLFFSEVMYDSKNNLTKLTMEDMGGNIVDYVQQELGVSCKIHTDPAMYYYRGGNEILLTEDYTDFWQGLASVTCNEELYMLTSEVMYLDETVGTTDLNSRIAQFTRFRYHDRDFGCVNTHWSTDAYERISNVGEILERLDEWKDISKLPNIIAGDLSVVSSADQSLDVLTDAGWKDVYSEKRPYSLGYTAFDSQERREDYIWANDLFYAGVEDIALVGRRSHDSEEYWSDHYGLLLTFNVDNFTEVTDTPTGMPVTQYPTITYRPTPLPISPPNITVEENPLTVEDAERHLAFDVIMLFLIIVLTCCLIPVVKWLWSTSSLNSSGRKTKRAAKYNQLEDPEMVQSGSESIRE